jgi:hypothetical protein
VRRSELANALLALGFQPTSALLDEFQRTGAVAVASTSADAAPSAAGGGPRASNVTLPVVSKRGWVGGWGGGECSVCARNALPLCAVKRGAWCRHACAGAAVTGCKGGGGLL